MQPPACMHARDKDQSHRPGHTPKKQHTMYGSSPVVSLRTPVCAVQQLRMLSSVGLSSEKALLIVHHASMAQSVVL